MKRITFFMALLLTCIIGATAADFVPTSGAKYFIKCKGNSKYVIWNSNCVKSASDNTVILSNWAQYDYRSLFSIEGNATDGYTIRSVKDNTQYVYAINTNDADGNVGVKAVTETPGDECIWKIVAQGDGWNIIPKNGEYSWNNRGSYNGNGHVGMWSYNTANDDIWYIQTAEDVANAIDITTGTAIGSINANYKATALAKAKAFCEGEGTEEQFNEFVTATNLANYINLPSGYYRMKNAQTNGTGADGGIFDGTYLFTDIINYGNVQQTLGNVASDEAKAKNNYIWKITRGELPAPTAQIVNGQGKNVNNGTNYTTITFGLSDFYTENAIYFTEGLHLSNQSHLTVAGEKNSNAEATLSNPFKMTKWDHTDAKSSAYIFEPVDMSGLTAYSVNIVGGSSDSYVKYNSTDEVALNGGFFLLPSAPSADAFSGKVKDGIYTPSVSVDGTTINATYVLDYELTLQLAKETLAKKGIGYPAESAEARTTLQNAITTAETAEHNSTTAQTLLDAVNAYKSSKGDIVMPQDGKTYVFTNVHNAGNKYMNYTADGIAMVTRGETAAAELPQSAKFTCHKVDGKYIFVNNAGIYLTWRSSSNNTDCTNGNKGYTTAYDNDYNTLTVAANTKVFGCLSFGGKRNDDKATASYYIVKNNGTFDRANLSDFYDDTYSSAFQFEEVTYPNTVTFTAATGIDGVSHIATFSAPFATIIPEGVKAYYVSAKDTKATMTAIDAEAIPANQGVILTSESGDAATMVPAAAETAATITANQLGHSAGAAKSLTAGEGYILANGTEGIAFYPCTQGTLAMNKAYLTGNGSAAITMDFNNTVTAISAITTNAAPATAPIYDLSGRRVMKAAKSGLYIQNGHKFIVK